MLIPSGGSCSLSNTQKDTEPLCPVIFSASIRLHGTQVWVSQQNFKLTIESFKLLLELRMVYGNPLSAVYRPPDP
jgi:hypothetical protein